MTHTAEPMTLEQVSDAIRCFHQSSIRPSWPSLEEWADAIDAELAKQRNAVDARSESEDAEEIAQWLYANDHHKAAHTIRTQLDVRNVRISELEHHSAAEVTDVMVKAALKAADAVIIDAIKAGTDNEEDSQNKAMRAALEAVASQIAGKDREDAERYRWLRDNDGAGVVNEHIQEMWRNCKTEYPSKEEWNSAIDAARKGEGHE